MFDIGSSELLMVIIIAVVVIGPKDLPRALYKVGQILGKAKAMSRHFRTGLDTMMREVEMEELEKKWAADNRRIMEQYPDSGKEVETGALPAPEQQESAPGEEPASIADDSLSVADTGTDVPPQPDRKVPPSDNKASGQTA